MEDMTMPKVYAQNQINGVVALVPAHYLGHPILGANLREVRTGKVRGRLSEIVKVPEPEIVPENEEPKPEAPKKKDK